MWWRLEIASWDEMDNEGHCLAIRGIRILLLRGVTLEISLGDYQIRHAGFWGPPCWLVSDGWRGRVKGQGSKNSYLVSAQQLMG